MHLVIVHGYLLSGTGSNIYTTNVAKAWKDMGHAVTVVCQDRNAGSLEFVDECFIGTDTIPTTAPSENTVRVVVPDIDDLLLVYVLNHYEGYTVKALGDPKCTEDEIDGVIDKTAIGLKKVLSQGVDRVLTNHTLLSPVIGKRACQGTNVPYDVKVHGSSICFSLKQRPELLKYAVEGLSSCQNIVVGTNYISTVLSATFKECPQSSDLSRKVVRIPPGMDPSLFQLLDSTLANQERFLTKVKSFVERRPNGRRASNTTLPIHPSRHEDLRSALVSLADSYDQWSVDADLISRWPVISEDEPIVCYFGAYLHSKGVGELLASFPRILEQVPKARLLIIGYGSYREHMEGMMSAFESGNVDDFTSYARAGDFLDCSSDQLRALFRHLSPSECQRVTITGMLEHKQLCEILPLASVVVVPSKGSEAFGMVTVEAMSCGVLSICNYHTGIKDVLDVVKKSDSRLEAIMHVDSQPGGTHDQADGAFLVDRLPKRVIQALQFLYPKGYKDCKHRQDVAKRLRKIAVDNFSWDQICTALLEPNK